MIAILISCFLLNGNFHVKPLKTSFKNVDYSEVSYRGGPRQSCETYCPDPDLPRANSLHDAATVPDFVYPPLIHHIRSSSSLTTLLQLITEETGLPQKYVSELISFGAVYLSVPHKGRTSPVRGAQMPSGMSTESGKTLISRKPDIRDKKLDQTDLMTRASRVMKESTSVPFGSYCRVHVNPRRHRAAIDGVNWKQRIICHRSLDDALEMPMLFVDKVAGAPVSPTVDNYHENMVSQVQSVLPGNSPPLHLSSRLDTCTSGIVPLARNEIAAAVFSSAIVERKIEKNYLALCSNNVPIGTLKHCFRKKSKSHDSAKPTLLRAYSERLLLQPSRNTTIGQLNNAIPVSMRNKVNNTSAKSKSSRSGNQPGSIWQLAELEVLSCRQLLMRELSSEVASYSSIDSEKLQSSKGKGLKNRQDGDTASNQEEEESEEGSGLFECEIRLVTGRTHQIRLQLAAIGSSILGDTRYSPVEGLLDTTEDVADTTEVTNDFKNKGKRVRAGEGSQIVVVVEKKPVGDGEHLMGPEPKRIGLQCARLFVPAQVASKLDYPIPSTSNEVVRQYDERRVEKVIKGVDSLSGISISYHDRTSRSYRVDSKGILITAGTPWWHYDNSE